MAATAGTMKFIGVNSGEAYTVDLYIPDAVSTEITFEGVGLAGTTSKTYWVPPEDVVLTEISVAAAPTAVGAVMVFDGSPVKNRTFRHANQLATLASRLTHKLLIPAGTQFGAKQF